MLGIHGQRLAGRDSEEGRIEIRHAVDEAAGPRVGLVAHVRIGVEQDGQIPAAIGRKLRDHVPAFGDHLPQALRGVDPAGEAARHAHNGDRLIRPFQQRTVGALQAINLDQRFAQRLGRMLELINHY
ncbi:hypothetical protein MCNS_30360 [Mycobacterium conspicuum]|uniref:Uncharacterized protein n=1 Tax=Mycobacterium conspicuum TaxID=44010 RepID=A0A7I7YG56_9MYCO|nr:hypothetical protein MCNS_30360 [Mycobacterium conspicuum]